MASLLDRLLGSDRRASSASDLSGMGASFVVAAETTAWTHRHRHVEPLHVVWTAVRLSDVAAALEARHVLPADVVEVMGELMSELPTRPLDEDLKPLASAELTQLWTASKVDGVILPSRLLERLALDLPRELTFLRKPLLAAAAEVAPIYDRSLTVNREGALTLAAWDKTLASVVALAQSQTDERWKKTWAIRPINLFVAVLVAKVFHDAFVARGVDVTALLKDLSRSLQERNQTIGLRADLRDRPADLTPSMSPGLFALLVRAERYAAEDSSDVPLRHALAALHDEPELAPFVVRLTA